MRNSEKDEVSNIISKELWLFSDPVRLIVPLLLSYAKNRKDFFILFELHRPSLGYGEVGVAYGEARPGPLGSVPRAEPPW